MNDKSARDGLAIELSLYDMYPPLQDLDDHRIHITVTTDEEVMVRLSFTINGVSGPFVGLVLVERQLIINNAFIRNYRGTWPAKVLVTATTDLSEASQTLTLYDTGNMQAERVDMRLIPTDQVQIPAAGDGPEVVATAGNFWDANGIQLPNSEVNAHVDLDPPLEGVEVADRIILVSSAAQAGQTDVLLTGAGATGKAQLTLVK
ncbi:MAG: hypothetical protein LBJ37_16530 [Paucimonas sp.]|jgi:hypothetical protein|nr:hypothetical protein [Paucimonas sp.]